MKEDTVLSGLKPDELMARGMLTEAGSGNLNNWIPPEVEQLEHIIVGYKVESMIAKGGMGAVYNVTQKDLNRVCALKLLPLEVSVEPGFEDRFILEARAMASLNHPNIMTIYDFGRTSEGHVYYVMEYVDGLDLSELIKMDEIGEAKAMEIMMQVCDALEYAHESGFVHRDVKPANIMIDKLGRVKVTDFGLAKLLNADTNYGMTMVGQVMGTPDYMAPEQSTGVNVDHRADIYALGVVLYELLTGTLPKGIFAPPSVKAEVDVKYDEVVIKAMQQQPEFRFQKVSEVKSSLQDAHQSSISKSKSKSKSKAKKKQKPNLKAADTRAWSINAKKDEEAVKGSGLKVLLGGLAAVALIGGGAFWFIQNADKENDGDSKKIAVLPIDDPDVDDPNTVAVDPLVNTDLEEPKDDLVSKEIDSLILDVKSSRSELSRAEQRAKLDREKAIEDEQAELNEKIELAKRAAVKREQAFKIVQNSQLAMQLSAGGTDFPETFFEQVDRNLLEDGAEEGDVDSQFLLGKMYQIGKGVEQDEETAEHWFKLATEQGHASAISFYREKFLEQGLKYYHGEGVTQDFLKALENFKTAADRGNTIAMNLLGWMYGAVEGVDPDAKLAASWYLKSAELGYSSAQYNLAECYKNGMGVDKDLKEAMKWYQKAAKQGNKRALPYLSDFFIEMLKKGQNLAEAVEGVTELAENGDAIAQCELGKLYVSGKGVERDPRTARRWFQESAEQGYARGQHNLGMCYQNGTGVIKNDENAVLWFKKAAEQDHAKAQRDLGNMYAFGKGVKKDNKMAADLYLKAARADVVEAQYNMGVFYARGLGVKKDAKKAYFWYSKAAEQNHIQAQFSLGVCYYNGVGVSRSKSKAKQWMTKAAAAGSEDAKKALKKLK